MADEERVEGGGLVNRVIQEVADRRGYKAVPEKEYQLLEASDVERRAMQKELDVLGWHVLDHMSGNPQEVQAPERRKMVQQARMVWLQDPLAGAAVDLRNDFVFGRGVPKPKAADEKVQEVIDEAWDDPDNRLILTTYEAQVALGTDMELQSNIFILFFEDGEDGKVKLGILDHDTVDNAVRDEDFRQRVLYYVARERKQSWDYENDKPKTNPPEFAGGKPKVLYYEHLDNVEAKEELGEEFEKPPKDKLGEGSVYHVATNRTSEQVFGTPAMRRVVKWLAAYNDFMAARVDMAQAAASFIMKRQIKGSPNQVAKIAAKAISKRSQLAGTTIDDPDTNTLSGPRPASILNENENLKHENFALNTNAGQAQQDAQMIRAQHSAASRFPQHYFGDQSQANLAVAQAMELPVTKAIEARQELFEGLFRAFLDHVIERAVDSGKLPKELTPEERAALAKKKPENQVPGAPPAQPQPPAAPAQQEPPSSSTEPGPPQNGKQLQQAADLVEYEGQTDDEEDTERDLSYDLSMPSPLKRTLTDLVTSVANIARTFDPNNSNVELSRTLLAIVLGEGLEVADPARAVERILPEGYVDPAVLAAQQAAQQQPLLQDQPNFFGPNAAQFYGPDGQQHDGDNPYGAKGFSQDYQGNQGQMQQAAQRQLPVPVSHRLRTRTEALDALYETEVWQAASDLLDEKMKERQNGGEG